MTPKRGAGSARCARTHARSTNTSLSLGTRGRSLLKAKHNADNNEEVEEAMNEKSTFEVGDWAWLYDDQSTVTGGGKHVIKANEGSSAKKSFALTTNWRTVGQAHRMCYFWSGAKSVR